MLNKEKFAKEIVDIAVGCDFVALKCGKPIPCREIDCSECERFADNIHNTGCSAYKLSKWANSEYKESILDDAEKRYLKGVIRPFRNEVLHIQKKSNFLAWISIVMKDHEIIKLPFFEKTSGMYKGMELGKEYTLEELGL